MAVVLKPKQMNDLLIYECLGWQPAENDDLDQLIIDHTDDEPVEFIKNVLTGFCKEIKKGNIEALRVLEEYTH